MPDSYLIRELDAMIADSDRDNNYFLLPEEEGLSLIHIYILGFMARSARLGEDEIKKMIEAAAGSGDSQSLSLIHI